MNTPSDPQTRVARIRAALESALTPSRIDVIDDSAAHAGHAGAATGKGHFRVHIESAAFAGLTPIKRHRLVHGALAALLDTDIHAVSIDARAPGEA